MAQSTVLSSKAFPPAKLAGDPVNLGQMNAAAGGYVTMGELFRPMDGVWPAVDAVNGPLKVNSPITNVAPSTTGMYLVPWTSSKFNKQSQNWQALPANGAVCQNTTTNRTADYAGMGLDFPAPIDTWWVADTAKLIVAYYVTTTHAANLGIATPNHEVDLYVEHEGQMKGITDVPAVWTHAQGGGNQMFYKSYEFSKAMRREFRLMLSAGCLLQGIYVDNGSRVDRAPNKPILFSCHTDSWGEGAGNVWSSIGGNGSQAGVTWPTGCSLLRSNTVVQLARATGMATIPSGEGGTGYFNPGPGTGNTEEFSGRGFSPFNSTARVNNWSTKYGPESGNNRWTTVYVAGGYNDGAGYTTAAYKAQALKGYNKFITKQSDVPMVVRGIQCKSIAVGGGYDLANTGLRLACAETPNVLGFLDDIAAYNYVDIWSADIGPDGLHPTVKGGDNIGKGDAKRMAGLLLPRSYVLKTMSVVVL